MLDTSVVCRFYWRDLHQDDLDSLYLRLLEFVDREVSCEAFLDRLATAFHFVPHVSFELYTVYVVCFYWLFFELTMFIRLQAEEADPDDVLYADRVLH